jgi:arsenate reductase-like glutaredoxin family protein
MTVTIYHNPACGTSRNVLALMRHAGLEPTVIEYLKTHFETVETEMNAHMKQLSRSRSTRATTATTASSEISEPTQQKRVRTAFQTSPPQTVCRRDVEIKVGFD